MWCKHRRIDKTTWEWILLFGFALLFLEGGYARAYAQGQPPTAQSAIAPSQGGAARVIHTAADEDYRVGSGDVIQIQIDKAPELSGTFPVGTDGSFLMPYLGRLVVRNRTPEELSLLIADGLRDRYLKNPRVVVDVIQYNSRTFFVQGAVRSPGVYQIQGMPTLLQLINIAGGLAENHGATAFVIRPIKARGIDQAGLGRPASGAATNSDLPPGSDAGAGAKYELLKANVVSLYRGNFDQDIAVEPGDIVNIPKTELFFVAGEVRSPGSFPQIEGTTLRQAISMAQGPTFKASLKNGVIFREDPKTGKHEEIRVDVGAIMKGKKDDVGILANDIVVIPNSRVRSVTSVLLTGLGTGGFLRVFPAY